MNVDDLLKEAIESVTDPLVETGKYCEEVALAMEIYGKIELMK